jgi:hypothetical protein
MQPEQIAKAIASKEGCGCSYLRDVTVKETFKGKTVWEGVVSQFELTGHKAAHCYAWVDPSTNQLVTVLELPPVDSPETAVRVFVVSQAKKSINSTKN